jgi:hypothetical protein
VEQREANGREETTMPKYHFHCTDGTDLVLDREGRTLNNASDLLWQGLRKAAELMQSLRDYDGWSTWLVSVHAEDGCLVETIPFPMALKVSDRFEESIIPSCSSATPTFRLPQPSTRLH